MACELFIYWHLAQLQQADEALGKAQRLQQRLIARLPGLQARLYRRSDEAAGKVTVMETYSLPGGLGPEQQALIEQMGDEALARWCSGRRRHVERFQPWA
jgi:hypothetical protein